VRWKADAAGAGDVRPAPPGTFDLIAIGNACHRLPRGDLAAEFEREVYSGLAAVETGDRMANTIPFAFDLARGDAT
jgi:hypothetical protein